MAPASTTAWTPDACADMVAGMEPMADVLAASGQYGPRVPVPDDADAQTRLLGLIGRDPFWTPGPSEPASAAGSR